MTPMEQKLSDLLIRVAKWDAVAGTGLPDALSDDIVNALGMRYSIEVISVKPDGGGIVNWFGHALHCPRTQRTDVACTCGAIGEEY